MTLEWKYLGFGVLLLLGGLLLILAFVVYPEYMIYSLSISGNPLLFAVPFVLVFIGAAIVYTALRSRMTRS
jgi:hypothetical protein